MLIVVDPRVMHIADVIVRVSSQCGLKAHIIKETHCSILEVQIAKELSERG